MGARAERHPSLDIGAQLRQEMVDRGPVVATGFRLDLRPEQEDPDRASAQCAYLRQEHLRLAQQAIADPSDDTQPDAGRDAVFVGTHRKPSNSTVFNERCSGD